MLKLSQGKLNSALEFVKIKSWLWSKFSEKLELFKKLEHGFLVQSTMNERAIFPDKIALPKANVKTNWMGSTK